MNEPNELLRRLLEASANSPLSEADPKSIDELMGRLQRIFNTPPLNVTDADIVDTVLYYRLKRATFSQLAKEKADKVTNTRTKTPTRSTRSSSEIKF